MYKTIFMFVTQDNWNHLRENNITGMFKDGSDFNIQKQLVHNEISP